MIPNGTTTKQMRQIVYHSYETAVPDKRAPEVQGLRAAFAHIKGNKREIAKGESK